MSTQSPIATGGGGDQFEQHVVAFALGLLLVRATPPILTDTTLVEVRLQTRHLGWSTDDILLVGETSDGNNKQLALQVKRTFTVSAKDDDCCKTIQGMWDDFRASRFDRTKDHLAIVILHGTSTLLRDFSSLLLCARATVDEKDFRHRLSLDNYLSQRAKKQDEAIKKILDDHNGAPVDAELHWRFLRVISVLSFDLNTPTSLTETMMVSLLSCYGADSADPLTAAQNTWSKLLKSAGEGRSTAKIYKREDLPSELLKQFATVSPTDGQELTTLFEHGRTVFDSIRSIICQNYKIDRSSCVLTLFNQLADHRIVLISGTAGSGKSALAKNLVAQLETNHPVLAFQAVEFATAHIDETLANAQTTLNERRLFALLTGHDQVLVLIDGVERLLEHSIRDAFSHLLRIVKKNCSIQIVLTVRDYSQATVRNALLEPAGLAYGVFDVPALSDKELEQIQIEVPYLALPLQNSQLRSFLRTPYLLDMASRLDWSRTLPVSTQEFREKCWSELIRSDHLTAGGMPSRREEAFLDIAYRRATKLCSFVKPRVTDSEAFFALLNDSLIKCSPNSSALFATSHDVLEDWAILHCLDEHFAISDDQVSDLANTVGGYPAIRRGFRKWLCDKFEINPVETRNFVFDAIGRESLPSYFRDDCLVSILLTDAAKHFLPKCRSKIVNGDSHLLVQIIHMLRVACKKSPCWFDVPGLPSQMLVATGSGWVPTLKLVSGLVENLLPEQSSLLLGFVEDWATLVDINNPTPDGFEDAGTIVDALLQVFEDYGFNDSRERLLKILIKIPRGSSEIKHLFDRAQTCNFKDHTASDFAQLILEDPLSAHVWRDFPAETIALVNARLRISEEDLKQESRYHSSHIDVDEYFGIHRHGIGNSYPASALKGPFLTLLQSHPQDALVFIIDFLNHAGNRYGNRNWRGYRSSLEPAVKTKLQIPDSGEVEQWGSERLYGLYRGISVGPHVLQSALMALEFWLLSIGKRDDIDLEVWLLYILRKSNNIMATSVVASVCIANPKKAGKAGLALLSSKEIVEYDRYRYASENSTSLNLSFGLNPSDLIYEKERKNSNDLEHRQKDLEFLAIEMQQTDFREDVWEIIDHHRSKISADQSEETRIWRLALHRMDLRGFRQTTPPIEVQEDTNGHAENRIYFEPGKIESDILEMIDENAQSRAITDRHLRLRNRAIDVWRDKNSDGAKDWKELLSEAKTIEEELEKPEEFIRGGPEIVAAICIRDHLDELNNNDFQWCVEHIKSEVHRDSDCLDEMARIQRGGYQSDRVAASVIPLLVVHERSAQVIDALDLLSLALTHPIDEVQDYAYSGVGAFLGEKHKGFVLRCVTAAAIQANLIARLTNEQANLPYSDRKFGRELVDQTTPMVKQAILDGELDVSDELARLDFDDLTSSQAIKTILDILSHHPNWDESRDFYLRTTSWLVGVWDSDKHNFTSHRERNHRLEQNVLRSIARFILNLSDNEALLICTPLIDAVDNHPRDVGHFLSNLIIFADYNTVDCFWEIWQAIADKTVNAPWVERLSSERSFGQSLIDKIFLSVSWKDDTRHWQRLDGHAHRLDKIAQQLPVSASCMLAYSRFLFEIGQQSLPESFKVVGSLFEKGSATQITSNSSIAFHLETLLRRFVYSQPLRLKSDSVLRNSILNILDALTAGGSSSAYRMRDDFVTPIE